MVIIWAAFFVLVSIAAVYALTQTHPKTKQLKKVEGIDDDEPISKSSSEPKSKLSKQNKKKLTKSQSKKKYQK